MLFQFTASLCVILLIALPGRLKIYWISIILASLIGVFAWIVLLSYYKEKNRITQETSIEISVISPSQPVAESQNVTNSQTVTDSQNVTESQNVSDSQIVTDTRMQYLRTISLPTYENLVAAKTETEEPPPNYDEAVAAFRAAHNGHHPLCLPLHICSHMSVCPNHT